MNERFNGKISRAKKVHSSLSLFFHLRPVTLNSNSSQRVRVSSFLPFSLPFPPKITFPRFSLAINLSLSAFSQLGFGFVLFRISFIFFFPSFCAVFSFVQACSFFLFVGFGFGFGWCRCVIEAEAAEGGGEVGGGV